MKKKLFIKQVITGIVGFLITAGIFVYIMGFTDILDGNKWGGYIAITVTVSAVFGFLLYIFGGKELFFWGAKLGFGFVAFMVFVQELPQPFSGILIAVKSKNIYLKIENLLKKGKNKLMNSMK